MTTAYYSDNDPFVCQWLRNLIAAGKITPGDVDERPIQEVQTDDVRGYDRCHFFAGIAGWDLALTLAGWDGPAWTGSPPCQPFSQAGKRQGEEDARHLWPAFHRLISECRPRTVFGEQVGGPAGYEWLAGVRLDLEADRYAVGAADLPAASVGAPHIRQRLWWVAHADGGSRPYNGVRTQNGGAIRRVRAAIGAGEVSAEGARHGSAAEPAGSGLAEAAKSRRSGWQDSRAGGGDASQGPRSEQPSGGCDRLGNVVGPRPQERSGAGAPGADGANPWEAAVATGCADGRTRRVGQRLFSMVDGLPGRVSSSGADEAPVTVTPLAAKEPCRVQKLRAYGNAIVPSCAAVFISAYMDVLKDLAP